MNNKINSFNFNFNFVDNYFDNFIFKFINKKLEKIIYFLNNNCTIDLN